MMSDIDMPGVARLLTAQLAAFLGLLLLASAIHKLVHRTHLKSVAQEFAGVPRAAAAGAVVAAACGEVLAAALLFVPACRPIGAWLAALIWGAYLAFMLRAVAQGRRDVDCGCSFGSTRHPLGVFEVARNAVLIAFAVLVAVSAGGGAMPMPASQFLAACAFLALYGALDQVMALRPLRSGAVL